MTRSLTAAEAGDIAITAAEGGIGYWAQIDTYAPSRWTDDTGAPVRVPSAFRYYRVAVDAAWNDPESVHDVTVATLRRGMALLVAGGARRDLVAFAAFALAEHDMGEIDAEGADVIVQLGLFGQIVYG